MSGHYKLTYFNGRGRAEPIRLLFAYGKIPYEDNRINREDWLELKKKMPWGSVPILEIDGKVLAQSFAIYRYLATKLDLYGSDALECAKIDEYGYAAEDLRGELTKLLFTQDPQKKEELRKSLQTTTIPYYMEKFSKLTIGPHLFGTKLTFADILLANLIDSIETLIDPDMINNSYPVMKSLKDSVFGIPTIKAYVEKRP